MKKILALLLAMLLCLGVLVACDTPEEPSSSSSEKPAEESSSLNEPRKDTVEYYFHKGFFEIVDAMIETKIEFVHSLEDYSNFTEGLSLKDEGSYGSFNEGIFETHYLLKVTMCSATRGEILGYRDFSVSENGELSLTLDNILYYDAKTIDSNGNVFYEVVSDAENGCEPVLSDSEGLPTQGSEFVVFYDFVLIPKDSVEIIENAKAELHIVTIPMCRN